MHSILLPKDCNHNVNTVGEIHTLVETHLNKHMLRIHTCLTFVLEHEYLFTGNNHLEKSCVWKKSIIVSRLGYKLTR